MRILVTGGNGFLGKHLVERLLYLDDEPSVFVSASATNDLRDRQEVKRLFETFQPDIVFHLAAKVGGIGANQRHPYQFFYDNATMGINVIQQSIESGIDKLIMVGTTCSYPKLCTIPFNEKELFDGYPEETNAPYGIVKRMLLAGLQAAQKEHGLRYVYLIPTNLYGPGDNFNPETSHVIPALIRKCLEAKTEITVWGTGRATRDFLYVQDCVDALVLAMKKYDRPEPLNVGSGQEINIQTLLYFIKELVGFIGLVNWDTSKPDGQPRRKLNTRAIKYALDWEAKTNLKDGLRNTIEWYKSTF